MAQLEFVKVVGRLGLVVGDTDSDTDEFPETVWCTSGEVWFTPMITRTKMVGASPVPAMLGHSIIKAKIDAEGYLNYLGKKSVHLTDLTDEDLNPFIGEGKATHRVEFRDVKYGTESVAFDPFSARFAKDTLGQDGQIDLTLAAPVSAGSATGITVGPQGVSVIKLENVDGELMVHFSNGIISNVGPLPPGPMGEINHDEAISLIDAGYENAQEGVLT